MSKSIKFKNNNYLDSSSIVHNKKTLKHIFENLYYIDISTDVLLTGIQAGSFGYKTFEITVPSGFIAVCVSQYTYGQISASGGIQITPIYNTYVINNTGSTQTYTGYFNYYAPYSILQENVRVCFYYLFIRIF